jgi:hypothetical protein
VTEVTILTFPDDADRAPGPLDYRCDQELLVSVVETSVRVLTRVVGYRIRLRSPRLAELTLERKIPRINDQKCSVEIIDPHHWRRVYEDVVVEYNDVNP